MDAPRSRRLLALGMVVAAAAYVCVDLARDTTSFGSADWDWTEAYRWFVVDSLRRVGRVPMWDPYACGGFPFWAGPESATIVVSPFLPAYLALPLGAALRIEVAGMLVVGLAGMWRLTSRFCRDPLLVALACVVGVLNSRWALQAAAGHTWHLHYGWLPWALLTFVNAVERPGARARWIGATGVLLALMAYQGAIYPLPHTLLVLGLYAGYLALRERAWRPLAYAAAAGAAGIALAAPKVLPVMIVMSRFPRAVPSREYLWPHEYLRTVVWPSGAYSTEPVPGFDWGYQEYGIYIGILGALVLCVGAWRAPAERSVRALRFCGIALMLLSLGLFGPWPLLHLVPPFRSQHVPTRFAYPGIMLLAVVAAAWAERALPAFLQRFERRWLATTALAVLIVAPVAFESRRCLSHAFGVHLPHIAERAAYKQTHDVPEELVYPDTDGPPSLTVHMARTGTIFCGAFHAYNHAAWKRQGGRPIGLGARGEGDPAYRGETYLEDGTGTAAIEAWSSDEVTVAVHGAAPGDRVVLNQNYEKGWTANGAPTEALHDVNAHRLAQGEEKVVFRFTPPGLRLGLAVAGVAALVLAVAAAVERARASKAPHG